VIFDEAGALSDLNHKDENEREELLQIQRDKVNESLIGSAQDPGDANQESLEEVKEDDEPGEGPGTSVNADPNDASKLG